jgi:hypothetical protein
MHRTWNFLILLALSTALTVHAQTQSPVLVTVELSGPSASTFVDRLHTRVYYATGTWALIELSPAQVKLARRAGHSVTVIDSKPDPDSYRLITMKRGRVSRADIVGAEVLLERDGILITRGSPAPDAGETTQGLKSVPLRPQRIALDNGSVVGSPAFPASTDSLIASIVARVNPDTVRWFIQHLQDFKTRYAYAANRDTVAEWIQSQFRRMGYATAGRDSFSYGGAWHTNVTATLPGIGTSGEIIVLGGHHDSNSGSRYIAAPGADDNASGTAAALETARVLKEAGYVPKVTIKFATFAAEEVGLIGSAVDADRSAAAGTNIKLMINHDMIANNPGPHIGSIVRVYWYSGSESWRELAKQATNQFTTLVGLNGGANSGGSDSYSYWTRGYPAVYFFEDQFSPVYHTPADTIGNINIDYCAEVIRASAATLLKAVAIPNEVRGLDVADRGDGSSLRAWWMPGTDGPAAAYRVSVGASSGVYDSSFTVTDTAATIGGLVSGRLYYVAVAALDAVGNESMRREKSGTPGSVPLMPADFSTSPDASAISLQWRPNLELDLLGYNIYRSESPGEQGMLLNSALMMDTSYTDASLQKHLYYYYTVRAMDSLFNESPPTAQLRSRLVSLDMGILLVDESADSIGAPGNPTEQEVDDYYSSLLEGYAVTPYDVRAEGSVALADMGAYSTVVWFSDDLSDFTAPLAAQDDVRKYIEFGGKFFFAGFRPTRAFTGNSTGQMTFAPGDFMWDVMGIRANELRLFSRCSGAAGVAGGYPSVVVDSQKVTPTDGYHLRNVEVISPASGSLAIYAYDSGYDTSSIYGGLKGKPVGVERITQGHNSVVLSFPLYYMKPDEARALVQYVLDERFNEVTEVGGPRATAPAGFALEQNYPNPFNPSTSIRFQLAEAGWVTLAVYDLLGREIAVLVDGQKAAGSYAVEFDARSLASGMYVYRLSAGSFTQSRKMMLVQ